VLMEPSAPAEVQGFADAADERGTFDPEHVYGAFPDGVTARAESARARAHRKRGISVRALPARSLVVFGDAFERERGRAIAAHYGIDSDYFPGLGHWDLVLRPEVRTRIFDFVLNP
ncbi:MAG: hypothetical protein M3323_07855, partial [Actinomycetota bacterium]|nr:hypothetical protein [Actinomycetota bacterium]